MLADRDALIAESVVRFFEALSDWKEAGRPRDLPPELDLFRVQCRKGVLPFAVLETRLNDRHNDVAELIDLVLSRIHLHHDLQASLSHAGVVADLEQAFECLCYVGFRRAQFVSAAAFVGAVRERLDSPDYRFGAPSGNPGAPKLTALEYRYLMSLLALCRARFDSSEREYYAEACKCILRIILEQGHEHVTVHDTNKIIRWFAHTMRIQPASHSEFLLLAREFGARFFKSGQQFLPTHKKGATKIQRRVKSLTHRMLQAARGKKNLGDNLIKEVAIATAIGRPQYAHDAVAYLLKSRKETTDKALLRRLETQIVDISLVAAYDELYGDWSPNLRKFLLNNPHGIFSHFINTILMRFGRYERAEKQVNRRGRRTLRAKNEEALLFRYTSRFEEARDVYRDILEYANANLFSRAYKKGRVSDSFSLMTLFWPVRMRDEIEYLIEANARISSGVALGAPDDALIVLCPTSFANFTQIPIHVLADLKGRGCSIISMTPGYIKSDSVSEDLDLNVTNAIYPHFYTDRTTLKKNPTASEWKIDLQNRVCEYRGINFYYTLHNTMGIVSRGYDIDWGSPIYDHYFRRYQTAVETMFDKHDRVLAYCKASGRKAKFILTEIQHGLAHALRLIAEQTNSSEHIEIFHVCNGFESYHQNLDRSQVAQFQCISNLTRHPDVSLAYRPAVEMFEDWYQTAPSDQRRAPDALAYAEKIESQATTLSYEGKLPFPGRPVIMLLGKILPDLPRPNDVGFIHTDVKEWFLDCCRFAHENRINLLVKPHPAEHNSQVSLYVNQEFTSFLSYLPPGIPHPVVVDRHSFPLTGLRDMVDGLIMWGGNSAVETALLKIPSMICGYYGAMDCPVGHFVPDTREAFEDFMTGKIDRSRLEPIREKTIAFLSYVLHPNHTIPSRFNNRSLYNAEVWPPVLYPETDELRQYGAKMANYILGDDWEIVPDR